jgi:putative membrane protein insertion efficiency factor
MSKAAPAARRPSMLVRLVDFYQRAAEGRPSPCRFTPSCSSYAREALLVHGSRRGAWLTIRRLLRCRPFGPSGFDPVPLPRERHVPPGNPSSLPSPHCGDSC